MAYWCDDRRIGDEQRRLDAQQDRAFKRMTSPPETAALPPEHPADCGCMLCRAEAYHEAGYRAAPETAVVPRVPTEAIEPATKLPWHINGPGEDGTIYINADEEGDRPVAMMMSGSPHNQDVRDAKFILAAVSAFAASPAPATLHHFSGPDRNGPHDQPKGCNRDR